MASAFKTSRISHIAIKLAALTLAGMASWATNAATVSAVGNSFDLSFNGIVSGNNQPGLTGSAHFLLTNISSDGHGGENWDFTITLSNTSTLPLNSSRISVLGFNTSPDIDKVESSADGVFNIVGSGNLAQIGGREVCFKNGGSGNNCSGGGNGGVLNGTASIFTARLNFNTDISALTLSDFAVRYQAISGSAWGDSGAGIGTEVPLPAPLVLFGSALAALGLKRRNRSE